MKTARLSKRGKSRFSAEPKQHHAMLRARVRKNDGDLLPLIKRAAEILRLDEADVIRNGCRQYAASIVYRTPMQEMLKLDA